LAICTACFSYRATISLDPAMDHPEPLPTSDIRRATNAVARSVEALELVADPRVDRIHHESQESDEIDNILVDLHKTKADEDTWVEVRSVVQKRTGKFFVLIEDRQSPFSSELTRAIEAAVISALEEEFPSSEVHFEERVVGPSLGP